MEVRSVDNLKRQIKSVELINAISVPGTKLAMDFTINTTKQMGVELDYNDQFIIIKYMGKTVFTPFTNVRFIILDTNEA